jgi:molybdate transport system ATP-binding protein
MSGVGVRLEHVELELGGRVVLGPVSLELAAGTKVLLLGANGAGKTQLLKLLAGERWPTPRGRERRLYLDARGRELELSELLPRIVHLGGERQDKYLRYDWNFSAQRVVGTGCHATDRPTLPLAAADRRRVRQLLRRLGLWALRRRRLLTLSYGERRRVLLARALAARPRLLLLDEPFNGLDAASRALLRGELRRLARTRLTLVLAAHRAEDAAPGLARALLLRRGRIVHDGAVDARVRRFLRGPAPPPRAAPTRRAPGAHAATARPLVLLRAVDLYRDYHPVLRGLNWTIGPGEHWGIVGANGSGKSTLLRFLYGDLGAALGGVVERRGHPPGTHLELWRRRVGFVSPELQAEYLARVSVLELVVSGIGASVGLEAAPTPRQRGRARAALGRVGLAVDPLRAARELSYGQLRLALLARALITRPEALLLDEPLTGLDPALRAAVRGLLSRLAAEGVQLVMAVHHAGDLLPEVRHVLSLAGGRARARSR